ncbi:MAG: 7-cyano-7-deazaguanine synthase QueC [Gammaproteobacteria bacterium]|nr:7-cyano-7-deazaguanine synthase QueC [Gammaproteobacteria bacterium]
MHHDSKKPNCIVLLSGGLDSTTVLALAKHEQYNCYALSFNYGQRHSIELESAKKIAQKYQVIEHKIIDVNFLTQLGHSALTDHSIPVPDYDPHNTEIPVTYVPARNTVFISIALGWAEIIKAHSIFIGASFIDYSGYRDCRPEYFVAYQKLIDVAVENITIKTPLLNLSKAETIQLGHSLGVNYYDTVSCYQANDKGHACGKCDSCALRKQGFLVANTEDQTYYY